MIVESRYAFALALASLFGVREHVRWWHWGSVNRWKRASAEFVDYSYLEPSQGKIVLVKKLPGSKFNRFESTNSSQNLLVACQNVFKWEGTAFFRPYFEKINFHFPKAYRSHFWGWNKAAPTVRTVILCSFTLVLLAISIKSSETGRFYNFFRKVLISGGQLKKIEEIDKLTLRN